MKKTITVLAYINPPQEPIELHRARIIKMTELEYFNATRDSLMYSATPAEMARISLARQGQNVPNDYEEIFRHKTLESAEDIGNFEWAVLETESESGCPHVDSYLALFDILNGNWRNLIEDPSFAARTPLSLVPTPRVPQQISLHSIEPNDVANLHALSKLLYENKRLQISLRSWWLSFMRREDSTDIIVNCCQALEAIFVMNQELRLCLALYTYHYLEGVDKKVLADVFELYGLRSSIVHGSKIINVAKTKVYIEIVGNVLSKALHTKQLPDSTALDKQIGIR